MLTSGTGTLSNPTSLLHPNTNRLVLRRERELEAYQALLLGEERRAEPTMPTQQDFLFVDAAQAKTSRQGRRNARSFVMQNARRKNPWSTSKHAAKQRKTASPEGNSPSSIATSDSTLTPKTATPSPPIMAYTPDYFPSQDLPDPPLTKGEVCPDCHIFLCRPGQPLCPRCILLKPQAPAEVPNNQLFDPFRTSSVEITKSVSELLTHFSTEMAPGIIAVDIRHRSTLMKSDWFGTAIGNPGFMHSLLSTIALHAYVFGKGTFDAILYHRAQAIAAVNAAILTPQGISDANIGAVFNLLTVEESLLLPTFALNEDHIAQLQIHQKGLQRMVQLRGGLKEIKTNRILQAFMLWHSTAHAIASFQAPNPSTLDFHLTDYCRHAGVKESLNALAESVLILIANLNVWFSDPESPLDPRHPKLCLCLGVSATNLAARKRTRPSASKRLSTVRFERNGNIAPTSFSGSSPSAQSPLNPRQEARGSCTKPPSHVRNSEFSLQKHYSGDCTSAAGRTPYYEAPSKDEDANSPVGPLQHHVAQPEFDAWESIDWAALSEGHAEYHNVAAAASATTADPVEGFGIEGKGDAAAAETAHNVRGGYGFAWHTAQHSYAPWMNDPFPNYIP
ncbi:hypothetical protein CFE70_001316 [Pyrenophora teres f. teres 0-1]